MNYPLSRSFLFAALASLFALLIVSCGGGDSSSGDVTPSASAGSGNVAILMTDGATQEFDEINVTVIGVDLLSDDDGKVAIFDGNETFNLLDLADDSRLFAIHDDVPAGCYNKIRLTLATPEGLELVRKDDDGNIIETAYPKLPGNGKLDLVPRGDFCVVAGETMVVEIDMDANKSIHIVQTGNQNKYQFRPVVFVNVVSDMVDGKFVRLHGVIGDIDSENTEFDLCSGDIPVPMSDDDNQLNGCIEVDFVADTSIFGVDGRSAEFGELVTGEEATVYGRFRRDNDTDDGDEVITDDADELDDLELVAAVVELGAEGAFQSLDGVAQAVVDVDDQFVLQIDPGQGIVTPAQINVQLQTGTKIINRHGVLLGIGDIDVSVPMSVNGVLDISVDPDILFASLVVIDTDASSLDVLTGTISENPDNICGFTLTTDTGNRSIRSDALTNVYMVNATTLNGGTTEIGVDELIPGQTADVYGAEGTDGCFEAETIIAFELTI